MRTVATPAVRERVAFVKSPKRRRSTTVRQVRSPSRRRRARRSTIWVRIRSSSSADRGPVPSARCEPIDPRRRVVSTGRGSRNRARACRCPPVAEPSSLSAVAASRSASCPTVWMPSRCSFSAVTAPTPQSRSTGSGCRNCSSRSGSTTSRPSGLLTALATLARNFVRATPTEIASPTSTRTRSRSAAATTSGVPARRRRPPTSRKASSIDRPSTRGVVSRKIANTSLLAAL